MPMINLIVCENKNKNRNTNVFYLLDSDMEVRIKSLKQERDLSYLVKYVHIY